MSAERVTLTLERDLLEEARAMSGGNLSRFVSALLREQLEALRRQRLAEELREGYLAEAATDLEIAADYRFVDQEAEAARES